MAATIQPGDLGQDQNNQNGQGPNSVAQAGQSNSSTSNSNQAGQTPTQNQSAGTSTSSSSGSSNTGQNAGQSAGNQATGSSQAGPAGANNQYNPNKQQGSGYTNIQQFVNANKGNQLGSAIGNNLQQTETSAQQNLQNAQNQFQQQTSQNQANTQGNQQLVQNVLTNPTAYANIAGATSPSATNSQDASQFQNLLSGQYQGPTSLTNSAQLQNQASNIQQMGKALQTSGGQQGLLQQLVGNPQYTQGQAGLDTLLLGQSNSPQLQAAKRNALTLQGQVNSAVTGATAQGQQNTDQSQQFGQALQNQLGNTVTSQNQALQQQAANLQNAQNTQYQNDISALQNGQPISQSLANTLGLTQGQNVYNVFNGQGTNAGAGASAFLTENPLQANVSNTANQQQYAQMQALQQLAGQYAPQGAQQAFQNFQNPSQAGTFQQSQGVIGNAPALQNALQGIQTNQQGILANPQASQAAAQQMANIYNKYGINGGNVDTDFADSEAQAALAAAGFGGALGGSNSQNYNWVQNNLATQNANLANAQNQVNTQYGIGENINIQPSAYPGIAQATGNNS